MSIEYIEGDILLTDAEVLAHGVAKQFIENMQTGLASDIWKKWPSSFQRFKKIRRSRRFNMGDVILDDENFPGIAYLATQPNLQYAELIAVRNSLKTLKNLLEAENINSCALPKIGCGYGALEWGDVRPIIDETLTESSVLFTVYEKYKSD
jgi:O-acetyl-ADP-ribose deacetylase (regulator of RNase III)